MTPKATVKAISSLIVKISSTSAHRGVINTIAVESAALHNSGCCNVFESRPTHEKRKIRINAGCPNHLVVTAQSAGTNSEWCIRTPLNQSSAEINKKVPTNITTSTNTFKGKTMVKFKNFCSLSVGELTGSHNHRTLSLTHCGKYFWRGSIQCHIFARKPCIYLQKYKHHNDTAAKHIPIKMAEARWPTSWSKRRGNIPGASCSISESQYELE